VLLCVVSLAFVAGCGGGDDGDSGPRTYVGTSGDVVLSLTWTRNGDHLTGSITQAKLDDKTNTVDTRRVAFIGTVTGGGVSITPQDPEGELSTFTGTLDGDALKLEYLEPGAGLVTVSLIKGDASRFNAAAAVLSDRATQAKADEQTAATENTERQQVADNVQTVLDDIAELDHVVSTARASKGSSANPKIGDLRNSLNTIKLHTQAAVQAPASTVCSAAAVVQGDVSKLEADIAALSGSQTATADDAGTINAAISKLQDDLATMRADDPKYLPVDAPSREEVNRALRAARTALGAIGKRGKTKSSSANDPNEILNEARRQRDRASAACTTGGA
jgi:hypothetical protein